MFTFISVHRSICYLNLNLAICRSAHLHHTPSTSVCLRCRCCFAISSSTSFIFSLLWWCATVASCGWPQTLRFSVSGHFVLAPIRGIGAAPSHSDYCQGFRIASVPFRIFGESGEYVVWQAVC